MLGPKILPIIFVALPAAMLLAAQTSIGEAADNACRTRPGVTAPRGMHWYYHTERGVGGRCWFLTAEGRHVRARRNVASTRPWQHVDVARPWQHNAVPYMSPQRLTTPLWPRTNRPLHGRKTSKGRQPHSQRKNSP